MRPRSCSSTGRNSEDDRSPPWSVFASGGFVAVLGFLAVAELLLRLEPVAAVLPAPRIYYTEEVLLGEAALERLQGSEKSIDVLFLGASIVRAGISPTLFDSLVVARTGEPLVSYNGALPALPPPAVNVYLERFYLPRTEPEVVVEGVNLATLQRTEESFLRTLRRGRMERAWLDDGPLDGLRVLAMERSRLVAYRGLLGSLLEPPGNWHSDLSLDARGHEARGSSIVNRPERGRFPPYDLGEGPIEEEIDVALAGLARSARMCRERGIDYVLVRLPEHGRRFEGREELFRAYVEALHEFARREGIRLLDPAGDPSGWDDDRLFDDGNHMSAAGARRFTTLLAEAWATDGR